MKHKTVYETPAHPDFYKKHFYPENIFYLKSVH